MPFAARFNERPDAATEFQKGVEEITKGVFQIWRFFSHVRVGAVSERVHENALGVVVTLDPWLTMARGRHSDLMKGAAKLADECGQVSEEDRRPVAFATIEELEDLIQRSSLESFIGTLRAATSEDGAGWVLPLLKRDRGLDKDDLPQNRPFAFDKDIDRLLPWWPSLREADLRTETSGSFEQAVTRGQSRDAP